MDTARTPSRARWAAVGAAVAIALGSGALQVADATVDSGPKPVYVSVPGDRILDTRNAIGLPGRFLDGSPRDLQVTGSVPVAPSGSKIVVPSGATGVVVTATIVGTTDAGFLSVRPRGATGEPQTSNVNFAAGQTVANAATIDLPADGGIQIWYESFAPGGTADVLIDVVGYLDDHTHDDRYYTEAESNSRYYTKAQASDAFGPRAVTESVSPVGFVGPGPDTVGWTSTSCRTNTSDESQIQLPLDLPRGVTLNSVDVEVYSANGGSGAGYSLVLLRVEKGTGRYDIQTIGGAFGGGGPGPATFTTVQLAPVGEVVQAKESFYIGFAPGLGGTNNGVCSVEVSYTHPTPP